MFFKVLFGMLCFCAVSVIVIVLLFSIPCCIYLFPFAWWSSGPEAKEKYKKVADCTSVSKQLRYATILYKHWIFKKDLTF